MHSLIQEIAQRMDLPPEEAEKAVSSILIRIRASLETIGEAEVEGLGTFRAVDGNITFEAAPEFAGEINKEFADMKPVALTATGESVEVNDTRALPGVETVAGDGSGEESQPEAAEPEVPPVEEALTATGLQDENEFKFESPPPPRATKFRTSPRERKEARDLARSRKEAREEEGEAQRRREDFPDMGSVVTTRPVQPIHSGVSRKRKSKMPVLIVASVVVLGAAGWLIFGTGGGGSEATREEVAAVAVDTEPGASPSEEVAAAPARPQAAPESSTGSGEVETVAAPPAVSEEASQPTAEEPAEEAAEAPPAENAAQAASKGEEAVPPKDENVNAAQEEIASESAVEEPPVNSSGPVYSWIVASYPTRADAESRRDALTDAGLDAHIYEATVHGRPAFRVGVGRFASETDALNNHDIVPPEAPDAWVNRVQ